MAACSNAAEKPCWQKKPVSNSAVSRRPRAKICDRVANWRVKELWSELRRIFSQTTGDSWVKKRHKGKCENADDFPRT